MANRNERVSKQFFTTLKDVPEIKEVPAWIFHIEEDADFMTFEANDAHSGKSWCEVCGGRCQVC